MLHKYINYGSSLSNSLNCYSQVSLLASSTLESDWWVPSFVSPRARNLAMAFFYLGILWALLFIWLFNGTFSTVVSMLPFPLSPVNFNLCFSISQWHSSSRINIRCCFFWKSGISQHIWDVSGHILHNHLISFLAWQKLNQFFSFITPISSLSTVLKYSSGLAPGDLCCDFWYFLSLSNLRSCMWIWKVQSRAPNEITFQPGLA